MAPSEERYCVQLHFALPVDLLAWSFPNPSCSYSLRAGPVGCISFNLYFDCKLVRYVTCDLINEYTLYNRLLFQGSCTSRRYAAVDRGTSVTQLRISGQSRPKSSHLRPPSHSFPVTRFARTVTRTCREAVSPTCLTPP